MRTVLHMMISQYESTSATNGHLKMVMLCAFYHNQKQFMFFDLRSPPKNMTGQDLAQSPCKNAHKAASDRRTNKWSSRTYWVLYCMNEFTCVNAELVTSGEVLTLPH